MTIEKYKSVLAWLSGVLFRLFLVGCLDWLSEVFEFFSQPSKTDSTSLCMFVSKESALQTLVDFNFDKMWITIFLEACWG